MRIFSFAAGWTLALATSLQAASIPSAGTSIST